MRFRILFLAALAASLASLASAPVALAIDAPTPLQETSQFSLRVQPVERYDLSSIAAPNPSIVEVETAQGEHGTALTLYPGAITGAADVKLRDLDVARVGREDLQKIEWLARNYLNRPGYPTLSNGLSPTDGARAAYQIAVWLVSRGITEDELLPYETGPTAPIVGLAHTLLEESSRTPQSLPDPIAGGSVTLTSIKPFVAGQRLRIRATEAVTGEPAQGQLVTLSSAGQPLRVLRTDASGLADTDVPYSADVGNSLQASRAFVVPAGSLAASRAQRQDLLLTRSFGLTISSNELSFTRPSDWERYVNIVLQNQLNGLSPKIQAPVVIILAAISLLFGLTSAVKWTVAKAHAYATKNRWRTATFACVVIVLAVCWTIYPNRNDSSGLDTEWLTQETAPASPQPTLTQAMHRPRSPSQKTRTPTPRNAFFLATPVTGVGHGCRRETPPCRKYSA